MLTVKIYEDEDGVFKNVDDAIKYMKETNFEKEVSIYDINDRSAYRKANEISKFIKEYNKGKPLDDQILPGNPYAFRGIIGCLGVKLYTITLGTYKRNHECIALFGGWNTDVLDTSKESASVIPGRKAMASLAMIGSML